jgi:hypothetical protein
MCFSKKQCVFNKVFPMCVWGELFFKEKNLNAIFLGQFEMANKSPN